MTNSTDFWRNIPKVVLHEHLDGNLRPETLLELCRARNVDLPADTPQDLQHWIHTQANSGSLERYVASFGLTVAAMATSEACERVAFEAVEDSARDGAQLIELRMAPLLLEAHGLGADEAVAAMLSGLSRGSAATGIPAGLIVCGMRNESNANVMRSADLALRFAGNRVDAGAGSCVVGFDLAGPERGFPLALHRDAVALAREAGLGITLHAGESDVGKRVMEAIELKASRIGHGVWITRGEGASKRMEKAREAGVHFEVCPTSNVHTGVCDDLAAHPVMAMEGAQLNYSVQADNRLISVVSQASEFQAAHEVCGLSLAQIMRGQIRAARASFLALPMRLKAEEKIRVWCAENSIAMDL